MSGAHTPGPWFVVRYGDGDSLVICEDTAGDRRITFMATPGCWERGKRNQAWHKIRANALLIAAAPDLLQACESAIPKGVCLTNRNIPDDFTVSLDCTMGDLRKLAAAIAKGRGQS